MGALRDFPCIPYFLNQGRRRDLNPRPIDYESIALPAELRRLALNELVHYSVKHKSSQVLFFCICIFLSNIEMNLAKSNKTPERLAL